MFPSSSSRLANSVTTAPQPAKRTGLLGWFRNLPIGRKQLIALFTCELVPILGFGIGSTFVLQNSLRTQLLEQAKSEVSVTETNYNIKINQMGFGSRGQSDNVAVFTAAREFQRNENLPSNLQNQLKTILQNEVNARKMEYATLVSKDLRIIGNANANRAKEKIQAPNLVELIQQSIKEGHQIKASEIVSWDELTKENPPLPEGFSQQDGLIRYVITPVRDPDRRDEILGVLIFGDLVDRKLPIVENTLTAFGGGYSAVYAKSPSGEFKLATSLDKADSRSPQFGATLSNSAILESAAAAKGETVTSRTQVGGQTYTIAARAMPNRLIETPDRTIPVISDRPAAILVRGTPEKTLNQLLVSSLQQEAIVFLLSIAAILFWSMWFRRLVIKPLENLQQTTEEFAEGDRTVRAEVASEDEVGQLAIAFNRMANSLTTSETALAAEAVRQERQAKEARALSEITVRMRRSLSSDSILQTAIDEIRNFLRLDRVMVYKFNNSSLDGTVIAESIAQSDLGKIGTAIADLLGLEQFEQYNQQSSWSVSDAELDRISDRYRENLATLGVKAAIVAPLKRNDRLVGLICAQHCVPRTWQESEIYFLTQMTAQIGYALDQAQLLQERQEALKDSETLKDSLQQQIIQLLGEVQGACRGDLTVRASVAEGDIGTVADFFNTIIENLRQLVIKVKQSAIQVNDLLSENGTAIAQLATEARQQAQETTHTLNAVEQMTDALQGVSDRAQQAATVAQTATDAAQSGEELMDTTVTSIYSLRATIEDATRKVKHLGESSQQIGRIVSLINDLAVQTDLLAINANIEASRAGEYGRGFGIVATEIGELATRSATATREIAAMIEAIQEQTNQVVEVMSHGATQVVEGSHLARNAKQSLIHVVQVSRQIDALVNSISSMVETQTETSRSLTGLIKGINEISDRTSNSSDLVSDALRQTVDVAEELKASVDQFNVNEIA